MRLDKYLKVSRLIKRRGVAKEFIEKGYVSINNNIAKASKEVRVGDLIVITSPIGKKICVRVTEIKETTKTSESKDMYEVVNEQ